MSKSQDELVVCPWPDYTRFTYDQGEKLINYDDATRALQNERARLQAELDSQKASHKYELGCQQSIAIELAKERDLAKAEVEELKTRLELAEEGWKSEFSALEQLKAEKARHAAEVKELVEASRALLSWDDEFPRTEKHRSNLDAIIERTDKALANLYLNAKFKGDRRA